MQYDTYINPRSTRSAKPTHSFPQARVKNVTRALIETGLAAKGYVHVNVDEGWLAGRDNNGSLYEDRVKFPSGMKALGDWIHAQEVCGASSRHISTDKHAVPFPTPVWHTALHTYLHSSPFSR